MLPQLSHRKQSLNLNVELTNTRKQFKERDGDKEREREREIVQEGVIKKRRKERREMQREGDNKMFRIYLRISREILENIFQFDLFKGQTFFPR